MKVKILVDSCSYFRLAQNIHPLLKTPFCEEKHVLGVITDLNSEYNRNPALRNKFYWVKEREYTENRKSCFRLSPGQKNDIHNSFFFLRDTARDLSYGVSRVDLNALSYAYVLNISVVTDDDDMLLLAKEYEIETLTSLELLKVLYECQFITIEKVRAIASSWIYLKDIPKSFKTSFKKLFNEAAPDLLF